MQVRSRVILKTQQENNKSSTSFQTSPSPSVHTPPKSTSSLFVSPSGLPHVMVQVMQCTKVCSVLVRHLPL